MALLLAPHVVGALLFLLASGPTLGQDDTEFEQRGQQLLHDNCSRCHAIEQTGTSPPFGAGLSHIGATLFNRFPC